ncbi:hypothetical protein [Sphingopyxis flava]|uniref:Uncharacterized protein n=1 Tax=Sphingopyxis flava TaxID=1507287 RepID=A0A1T5AQJ8_9SPHN|nr:hypothetical protein [Sphingopyxis flava]SKB37272.1 hypothetical protein SAMN06295937_1004105 [Sphingopyxis flava]
MLHLFLDDRPWFRPKTHGYGAGLPIAWQGWVMLAMHVALIAGLAMLLNQEPVVMTLLLIIAAFAPLPLYHARTKGGWRWRWGERAADMRRRKGRRK